MNNLPNKIDFKDDSGYGTLELPQCIYCGNCASEDNPVKVWAETQENVCFDCRMRFLEDEYFPKTKSPECEIHGLLF